jgi:hypothetical protein
MPSWDSRSSELSSRRYGLNPDFARAVVVDKCNVWFGDFDLDQDGTYEPLTDICDDWKPLGDPSPAGRLTAPELGDRAGGHVAVVERGKSDTSTVWAATSTGRVFISKNADDSNPAAVQFARLDSLAANDQPRYPSAIYVDPRTRITRG